MVTQYAIWKASTQKLRVGFCMGANILLIFAIQAAFFTPSHAQSTDNKPLTINSSSEYKSWIKQHKGKELVELKQIIKHFRQDMPYKTVHNFTNQVLYPPTAGLFLCREAAEALAKVQDSLLRLGKTLLIFDAYRPYAVTEKMWEAVPDENYAANPAKGSGHNRGIAVDLTLADLATGQPLTMPTTFDSFSDTAHHTFTDLPAEVLANRALLKGLMEHFGFLALRTEWWHYSLPDPRRYPLLNLSFAELKRALRQFR